MKKLTIEQFEFCYSYNKNIVNGSATDADKKRYDTLKKYYEGLSMNQRNQLMKKAWK